MALTTTYLIVPFFTGLGGLHPGAPHRAPQRGSAIAMADQLAAASAGVIVLQDSHDPAADVFLEPELIWAIGSVPGDLFLQLAA